MPMLALMLAELCVLAKQYKTISRSKSIAEQSAVDFFQDFKIIKSAQKTD